MRTEVTDSRLCSIHFIEDKCGPGYKNVFSAVNSIVVYFEFVYLNLATYVLFIGKLSKLKEDPDYVQSIFTFCITSAKCNTAHYNRLMR